MKFPIEKGVLDTKSIPKLDPSNISDLSRFEITDADDHMEKCACLMDNLDDPIDQNNKRETASDGLGSHGDHSTKKIPFARDGSPGRRRGGIYIPAKDLEALARSINSNNEIP